MNDTTGYFRNISDTVVFSLEDVWLSFLSYVPNVVAALIIVILGWIVATVLSDIVRRLVRFTGIDSAINRTQINERLGWSDRYHLLSGIIGTITKWLILIATLMAAADILNMPQITLFLQEILFYIPQVIVAVIILTVGIIAANFVATFLEKAFTASKLNIQAKGHIASIAKYAIIVFSVMAALTQLGIVPHLIQILFGGVVLALALAFGLGGREEAARFLSSLREGGKNNSGQ